MYKWFRTVWAQFALILVFAAGIGAQSVTDRDGTAAVGDPAPPLALPDLSGKEIRLHDFQGKGVLLHFWASWCPPCANEMPFLNEAYKLTKIPMLAVNMGEDQATVLKFAERFDLTFPILLDRDGDVWQSYGAAGLPLTVLIDEQGNIIERHVGEFSEFAEMLHLMERLEGNEPKRMVVSAGAPYLFQTPDLAFCIVSV